MADPLQVLASLVLVVMLIWLAGAVFIKAADHFESKRASALARNPIVGASGRPKRRPSSSNEFTTR